ncbi:MAG: GNAT family N-acetyltransferase [Nanoarchaeota archaeon]|nr:GNAT family N-acetyltransferase [Nanoarchaeota archaeon]
MEEKIKIRKVERKDLKEIVEIYHIESSKKPYNETRLKKESMKEVAEFYNDEFYVAVKGDIIIGFIASCITNKKERRAYILELWLKNEWKGKGIGKELMNFIEDYYSKKGIKKIRLTTKKKARAFGFYEKLKYKEKKDLVYMEKKL